MKIVAFTISLILIVTFSSCEKEYMCVCTSKITGEKSMGAKVKTTKLGKKGFEKSCRATNDDLDSDLKDCHLE